MGACPYGVVGKGRPSSGGTRPQSGPRRGLSHGIFAPPSRRTTATLHLKYTRARCSPSVFPRTRDRLPSNEGSSARRRRRNEAAAQVGGRWVARLRGRGGTRFRGKSIYEGRFLSIT